MPSIYDQIRSAELFIDNMERSAAVRDAFATVGRGGDYVQEGRQLLDEALRLYGTQQNQYGDQYGATDGITKAREAIHDTYMAHLELARALFEEDRDAQADLGLRGERRRAFDAWLGQVRTFYTELLASDAYVGEMATLLITREDLEAALAEVEALAAARSKQQDEIGEAQNATEERDRAIDRLMAWVAQNRRIGRVVLRHTPQHLEALGIRA